MFYIISFTSVLPKLRHRQIIWGKRIFKDFNNLNFNKYLCSFTFQCKMHLDNFYTRIDFVQGYTFQEKHKTQNFFKTTYPNI